jgi:hypothetical protein
VNDTTEPIPALDLNRASRRLWRSRRGASFGWIELQRSVGPVTVVMIRENGENSFEVLLIQNQQPIKAF